jgi:hypothetical protein
LTAVWCDGLVSSEERTGADDGRQLRERLKKVEALYFGATTEGERGAAEAAVKRLKAKLDEISRRDPPIEMKFSLPDEWSVRLFIALCRRYGVRPFRYPRQRSTTIMVGRRDVFSMPLCGGSSLSCIRTSGFISSRPPSG